jgi:hypothetical protein
MTFGNPSLSKQATQQLLPHLSHKLSLSHYGGEAAPDSIAIECENCHEILIEFLPQSGVTERPDPKHVRYEGHYDEGLDLCYVEVFKPGKSPYPMRERQDIINHSPTGIAWGYGGSGPAQCAFAILMDYLGDEERARALYQHFKFNVTLILPMNEAWTLTGTHIEQEIVRIEARSKQP